MSRLGVLLWRHLFESGDRKRLAAQVQDLSDLHIIRDMPYLNDGEQGHLFDIYELPGLPEDAAVLINIHGGGLFASYKEVNVNFNYEWARLGYRVVSLSYRRIPETTLWHQVDDCMAALRYLKAHAAALHLNLDRCVLTGDSAGALLSLFCLSINGCEKLQRSFGIEGAAIPFRAAGLISIMLDTQRRDLMGAITHMVEELHRCGVRICMQTIAPRLGVARTMGRYDRNMETLRLKLNDWIRSAGIFDCVFDAEAVVREERPDGYYYAEGLHQGDHLHPNARGGQKLADAFDLGKLTGKDA